MKKLLTSLLAVATMFTLTACGGDSNADKPYAGQELHLYNWGEYMGENFISGFEDLTGATVVVDYFDSNEAMYIKVANGEPYDILVPSDYMIERLIQEDLIQKLDKDKITCMDELVDAVKGLPYDPNNEYSVPYFWGSVGIVYNKNNVPLELLEEQGFAIMQNTDYKGRIYMYDSERDSFMIALKALGYSMNTSNEDEINEACAKIQWLIAQSNPYLRGDDSIASTLTKAIYHSYDMKITPVKQGIGLDFEAFYSNLNDYIKKYPNFFEKTPVKIVH